MINQEIIEIQGKLFQIKRKFPESQINLNVKGITESPILGPKGNKEFLIYGQN